jgi:alanine racemase
MSRPIRARIDHAALRHNLAVVRQQAGAARSWCVVKADAYGHGLLPAVLALTDVADGFALIELEAAVMLRDQGIRQPILLLEGFYQAEEIALFAECELTPVLHSLWQVEALAAARLPVGIPVYLKIETGMHRLGIAATDLPRALQWLEISGAASSITLMTHFADADDERGISEQLKRFRAITAGMTLPTSMANSAALLRFPAELEFNAGDWVRPGIMLYGSSPFPAMKSAAELGLRPVMTLESQIIAIRELEAGDRVGYGGSFIAEAPMRVGIVACGYGDGYPRHAPTGTPVSVGGQRTRTLGRPSMDKLCVDLTDLEKVGVGDAAVLWGGDANAGVPADEVAQAAGTIAYELFCALAGRVPVDYSS